MTNILITAIGGDISQGAASITREAFPSWRMVGADISSQHGGSLFVDELLMAPPANDEAYVDWLSTTIAEKKVDLCWPLSEPELQRLAAANAFETIGCPVIYPGKKAVEIGNDKLATAEFLRGIGIPAPWTVVDVEALKLDQYPCIYKPRSSAGSKAVFICKTAEEAQFFFKTFPGGVFQELLLPADKEVTCAVYRSRQGETAVFPLLRRLTGGLTGWAESIQDAEVDAQCKRVAEALDLQGAINIQLRITPEGPRIFEINARLSSTAMIRHQMGFTDAVWSLKEALGESIELKVPAAGMQGVRVQSAALIKG